MTAVVKLVRALGGWAPVVGADPDRLAEEHLGRPEGYLVDDVHGRPLGVVEELERSGRDDVLVVAADGWLFGGRRRIPTRSVVEIHPDERLLVVDGDAEEPR